MLAPEDEWIKKLDLEGFGKEVHELGQRLQKEQGEADQKHLHKMAMWNKICAFVGLSTMWMKPNLLSAIALSLYTTTRWTMIGHHASHGGYNHTDKTGRYSSRGFALGSVRRRVRDWLDWMLPEAWGIEHNQLHHYRLGEVTDPDLVERNVEKWKGWQKYARTFASMVIWKWAYYAPNTFKELKVAELRRKGEPLPEGFDPSAPMTMNQVIKFAGSGKNVFKARDFFCNVLGPYFLMHFVVLPLPLALINPAFYWHAVANLLLADVLANFHSFVIVATNHCGNDLYRFEKGCKPKSPTFYLRAVISSTNFPTGSNINDFAHGWLNYQIEHHAWPNLSMRSYQKGQPQMKAICEKHGVPYVQENVFTRLKKTYDVMVGKAFMRKYPDAYERPEDLMVWKDEQLAAA